MKVDVQNESPVFDRVARVFVSEIGVGFAGVALDVLPEWTVRHWTPPLPRVVVETERGADAAILRDVVPWRPGANEAPPAWRFLRFFGEADARAEKANEKPAAAMAGAFLKRLRMTVPDARLVHVRLSLGGGRLYLRWASESGIFPSAQAAGEIARVYGVDVDCRQLGSRDVTSFFGAVGPCGKPCCCASWQKRYPTSAKPNAQVPFAVSGVCGRWRCCSMFE